DFGNGSDTIQVAGGASAAANILITAPASSFTSFNLKAPTRCQLTFTASTVVPSLGVTDPAPSNNVAIADLDLVDKNDTEQTTTHESIIYSPKPLKVTLKDAAPLAKNVKVTVGNADYLPTPEAASAHSLSVTELDGDCPPITSGGVTFDSAA